MKTNQSKRIINIFLLILLSHCTIVIDAWGTLGHEMIGNLAWYHLSPQAKLWVNETLKPTLKNNADPTMTPLGKVADWADRVRHYLGWSAPLHFIDVRDDLIPGGCVMTETTEDCRFQYERDCVNDVCAAGAILNYTKQLMKMGPSSSHHSSLRRDRRSNDDGMDLQNKQYNLTQSLMFLTHFVGDIHQPLHASRKSDKGGNDYHVHFSLADVTINPDSVPLKKSHHHSWNLHSVWDTAIIEVVLKRNYKNSRHVMEQDLYQSSLHAAVLEEESRSACSSGVNGTCVVQWGAESFALALKYAYVESDNTTQVSSGSTLDELYYESRLPIIKQQLILGGIRLAATIEAIVSKTTPNDSSAYDAPSKLWEVWKAVKLSVFR